MEQDKLSYIFSKIDHTLLSTTATLADLDLLCKEAEKAGAASVCVPPCYIEEAKKRLKRVKVCTVIGFPNGYMTTAAKVFEAKDAIARGADEVDMVINVNQVKNGNLAFVEEEIAAVRKASEGKILKVIIETCLLTEEEKIALCGAVTRAGADFIKTSTGFSKAGATIEDVRLFKKHIGENVKIKAAGGIRSAEDALAFLSAGADRIGASAVIKNCLKK